MTAQCSQDHDTKKNSKSLNDTIELQLNAICSTVLSQTQCVCYRCDKNPVDLKN